MNLIKHMRRGLTALGLGVLAGSLVSPALAADTARPALWSVSDPDTTIYLFGTFHMLPKDYRWQSRAIEKAVTKSEELVIETIVDTKNPAKLAAELGKVGFAPGLIPLASRINPALRPQLATAIAASGVPAAVFDRMKTWTAAFTLAGLQFKALGLDGEAGVEPILRTSFEAKGKPIGQLETNGEQLAFFDTLSQPAQRAFLEGTITDPGKMREEFAAMLKSWANGDVAGIARSFNADLADSSELRDALLTRRNANWTRWIEKRLAEKPGTMMVAVGAGHLAGDQSVIELLKTQGYTVKRVQ